MAIIAIVGQLPVQVVKPLMLEKYLIHKAQLLYRHNDIGA